MALMMVQRMGTPPIPAYYHLFLTVQRGGGLDLGNCEKAVSDALQEMRIIVNDKFAEKIVLQWGDIIGCEVTIIDCPAPMPN